MYVCNKPMIRLPFHLQTGSRVDVIVSVFRDIAGFDSDLVVEKYEQVKLGNHFRR